MRRRADKIDSNQEQIVKALRSVPGVTVAVGHDDILVGYRGRTYWFEIKRPGLRKKDGTWRSGAIRPGQQKLLSEWAGHYSIVSSLEEIMSEIGVMFLEIGV